MSRIRIGIIGSDGGTRRWADVVAGRSDFQLVAVSDRDPAESARLGADFGVAQDSDSRTFIIEHRPDVIVFAGAPSAGEKIVPFAADQACATILDSPPTRTLDDAAARVAMFQRARRPILVRSGWRLDPDFDFAQNALESMGKVQHASALVVGPPPAPLGWRGDRVRGGGVIRCAAYDAIDLIIACMGVPSDLLMASRSGQRWPEPCDAEDTASLLMRFADGRSAALAAAWRYEMAQTEIHLGGSIRSIRVASDITRCEASEDPADPVVAPRRPHDSYASVLTAMAEALNGDSTRPAPCTTLRDHLATLAVIETAHLSAKTSAPEAPHLILSRHAASSPR